MSTASPAPAVAAETDTSYFQIEEITTDSRRPKDFRESMKRCVGRKQHVDSIIQKLEDSANDVTVPGVYMSGPAGVGKSILAYMIAQIFKLEKGWVTIYIPDCRVWAELGDTEARGFFLDRVRDALADDKWKQEYPRILDLLDNPPANVQDFAKEDQWSIAAHDSEMAQKMNFHYASVVSDLRNGPSNVLFVCDEVNALWGVGGGVNALLVGGLQYKRPPFSLTNFGTKWMKKGALLVTGTTDNDFVSRIPDALGRHVYPIGKWSSEEIDLMKNLEENETLKHIAELDASPWGKLVDAAGSIPRELRLFVEKPTSKTLGKRIKDFIEEEQEEPARKTAKLELLENVSSCIEEWRSESVQRHETLLQKVLKSERSVDLFKNELFKVCSCIFLEGRAAPRNQEVLRVPNFVITEKGMYPTTVDAQKVYFRWFCEQERQNKLTGSVAELLQLFLEQSGTGGERGNAFEKYLAAKLTSQGDLAKLAYRRLDCGSEMVAPMRVSQRVFATADHPPKDYQHYPRNTLLTHTDLDGGEARIDLIHYQQNRVVFIEATVGNYRNTKIPKLEDPENLEQLILDKIKKWLGKDVYDVEVIVMEASGQQLQAAPKKLSVKYRATRSNFERPVLPEIHYVVATTCPILRLQKSRIDKYNWIEVCVLEDLIKMDVFKEDMKKQILKKQAKDANGEEK